MHRSIPLVLLCVAFASPAAAQPAPRPSPDARVTVNFGGSRVSVIYGRPYMKHPKAGNVRTVWGGELVPPGKVWRLGANEATMLTSQAPLEIGGIEVPAGAHTLYFWMAADGTAKLIINKQLGQWGLEYSEAQDLARVDLKKETVSPAVEQLTIGIEKNPAGPTSGLLTITWDTVKWSVPFTVKK
jgi:hypothetical protein